MATPRLGLLLLLGLLMVWRKFGPVAALILAGVAFLLLALAPLGWRLGWWQYGFGLYSMMPVSGCIAAGAVILSVLALLEGWSQLHLRDLNLLLLALAAGAALAYVPWHFSHLRSTLPPIHDITTDPDNPPTFSAVLAARAAEHAGSVDHRHPELAQLQRAAYPDLQPLRSPHPVTSAFKEVLQAAKAMPGWTVIAFDANAGRIEASQQSRWFRFTDDIVIRVVGDAAGSRIDMRSTSRQGRSDYGVNAARIRSFMGTLKSRIG